MPKNKVLVEEEDKDYFYEITGVSLVLFSIILLGRLGSGGAFLSRLFKITFGDYYTIILLFLLIIGVRAFIKKKYIDIRHISFLGFVLVYLGLSLFCHLSVYEALDMTPKNVLTKTISLYGRYLKYYEDKYVVGGGIIASLFFQLIIILFGRIGLIIISIVIILTGVSFIFQTHFIELILKGKFFSTLYKKTIFILKNYFGNIKITKKSKKSGDKPMHLSLGLLSDVKPKENITLQQQINLETKQNLESFIGQNKLNIIIKEVKTSFSSSRFILSFSQGENIKEIKEKLYFFFMKNCIIRVINSNIIVDIPNQFRELLTLKRVLSETISYSNSNTIGFEIDGKPIVCNLNLSPSLLLIGDSDNGVESYIRCFISELFFKSDNSFLINVFDFSHDFEELLGLKRRIVHLQNEEEGLEVLEDLFQEYERRIELFKFLEVDSINDANKEIRSNHVKINKIDYVYNIIHLRLDKLSQEFIEKLNYIIKFGYRVGIYQLISIRSKEDLQKLLIQNSQMIFFQTQEMMLSVKLLGSDMACYLQKKGDCLFVNQDEIYHGQSPFLSSSDYYQVIKKIIS